MNHKAMVMILVTTACLVAAAQETPVAEPAQEAGRPAAQGTPVTEPVKETSPPAVPETPVTEPVKQAGPAAAPEAPVTETAKVRMPLAVHCTMRFVGTLWDVAHDESWLARCGKRLDFDTCDGRVGCVLQILFKFGLQGKWIANFVEFAGIIDPIHSFRANPPYDDATACISKGR